MIEEGTTELLLTRRFAQKVFIVVIVIEIDEFHEFDNDNLSEISAYALEFTDYDPRHKNQFLD